MIGENWPLVTDEPVEFENWSSRLEKEVPVILEEFIEYTLI